MAQEPRAKAWPDARTHPSPGASAQGIADQPTRLKQRNVKSPRHPSSHPSCSPPSGSRQPAGSETARDVAGRDGAPGLMGPGRFFTWRAVGDARVQRRSCPVDGGVRCRGGGVDLYELRLEGRADLDFVVSAWACRVSHANRHRETCLRIFSSGKAQLFC